MYLLMFSCGFNCHQHGHLKLFVNILLFYLMHIKQDTNLSTILLSYDIHMYPIFNLDKQAIEKILTNSCLSNSES